MSKGCPSDQFTHIEPRSNLEDRFDTQTFKFPSSDFVYIQCDVIVCDLSIPNDPDCQSTCRDKVGPDQSEVQRVRLFFIKKFLNIIFVLNRPTRTAAAAGHFRLSRANALKSVHFKRRGKWSNRQIGTAILDGCWLVSDLSDLLDTLVTKKELIANGSLKSYKT